MRAVLPSLRLLGLAALLSLTAIALRAAPADEARRALEQGVQEITAALRAPDAGPNLPAVLAPLADRRFAFATTTRLAVGPAWRDFTPEQRTRAAELFGRLVVRTYAGRLRGEAATAPVIDYGAPVELRAGRVEVPTTTRTAGQTYAIAYRLELGEDGGWRIYDVVAEGVSLVGNYRAQFEPALAKGGAPALLRMIEAKLAEPASPAP